MAQVHKVHLPKSTDDQADLPTPVCLLAMWRVATAVVQASTPCASFTPLRRRGRPSLPAATPAGETPLVGRPVLPEFWQLPETSFCSPPFDSSPLPVRPRSPVLIWGHVFSAESYYPGSRPRKTGKPTPTLSKSKKEGITAKRTGNAQMCNKAM